MSRHRGCSNSPRPRLQVRPSAFDPVGIEASDLYGWRRRCDALNVLAQIRRHFSGFDRLRHIVRVDGHVASADGFLGQPAVVDGASHLFATVLPDKASHRSSAFSQRQLPADTAVILVVIPDIRHTWARPARSAPMPLRRPRFSISNRVRPRRIAAPSDRPRPLLHKAQPVFDTLKYQISHAI
ncbi:RidA family protein [Burkholderia multivorans]|uniref:RidA family protein n=1 Tax=Burkholderia multivorans TaxID=87883 RepID=A0AAP2HJL2_9BURK|nr:RidA family protein [Burkholderia multivorans]MBU9593660.1 RidA family protein [Burkholderia multivorans]